MHVAGPPMNIYKKAGAYRETGEAMEPVIIAYAAQAGAQKIRMALQSAGIPVLSVCSTASAVLAAASKRGREGIVISGFHLPDMAATEMVQLLPRDYSVLLLLAAAQEGAAVPESVTTMRLPIQRQRLVKAVYTLCASHGKRRPRPAEKSAAEKESIRLAKERLMQAQQLTEAQAYRYLQKMSMDMGWKMEETAKLILSEQK